MGDDDRLDLISTEQLIEELFRRVDHGVFAGFAIVVDNQDGTGDNEARHVWKGCSITCAGLATELQYRILRSRSQHDLADDTDKEEEI